MMEKVKKKKLNERCTNVQTNETMDGWTNEAKWLTVCIAAATLSFVGFFVIWISTILHSSIIHRSHSYLHILWCASFL